MSKMNKMNNSQTNSLAPTEGTSLIRYYIYDKDDYKTPKKLYRQDWVGKVVEETVNDFDTEEEAKHWCWIMNSGYISRKPYVVESRKKTYTKASLDYEFLVNFFGIEVGFMDCSINSIEDLEKAVDNAYPTKEDILKVIHEYGMIDNFTDNEF